MRQRRSYTVADKRKALALLATGASLSSVSATEDVPIGTLCDWRAAAHAIQTFKGSQKRKSFGGAGRPEMVPFAHDLVNCMKDLRRDEEVVSSLCMIEFMKENYRDWLDAYLATEPLPNSVYKIKIKSNDVAAYNALMRLCQRFAHRHGFSQRVPSFTKLPSEELLATKASFAREFWHDYGGYGRHEILNVDEAAIYHDTPPHRTWALRGGSSKINKTQKHSARLTAVLTIRADGKKLPLFFIVRCTPGGTIETEELPTYPPGHHYAVQKNAWMDSVAWNKYVTELLRYEIEGPSVLLLDNFDAHVTEDSKNLVAESACCAVCPLPANATAVCQPLNVGVMGPLKAKLRSLWLKAPTGTFSATRSALQTSTIVKSFEEAIPRVVEL